MAGNEGYKTLEDEIEEYKVLEEKAREKLLSIEPKLQEELSRVKNESADMSGVTKKKTAEKAGIVEKEYSTLIDNQEVTLNSSDDLLRKIKRMKKDTQYAPSKTNEQKRGDENNG